MWLATVMKSGCFLGARGVPGRWVESTRLPVRDGPAGVEKGSPGQPAPLCPECRPGRPDLRKSASGGCPVRHASPPRRASLAPHCYFLEALAQASLAEPTGPRGTGRHPLQEFPFQREEAFLRGLGAARGWGVLTARRPSSPPKAESERAWGQARLQRRHRSSRACLALRCVPPGPLASGAGGGPTRGASCLELRRRWAGAVPGAPWCRDSPEKGRRGQSMVLMAGVSPRWGSPRRSSQRALGGHWRAKGGLGGRGDGREGASVTVIRGCMALPPSPSSTLEDRPCWNVLGPAGRAWGSGHSGLAWGQKMLLPRASNRNRPQDPAGKCGGVKIFRKSKLPPDSCGLSLRIWTDDHQRSRFCVPDTLGCPQHHLPVKPPVTRLGWAEGPGCTPPCRARPRSPDDSEAGRPPARGPVTVDAIRFNGIEPFLGGSVLCAHPASLRRQQREGDVKEVEVGDLGGSDVSPAYKGRRAEGCGDRARTSPAPCPPPTPPRRRPRASAGPSLSWTPSRPRPSW